jgi:hypothetical protein
MPMSWAMFLKFLLKPYQQMNLSLKSTEGNALICPDNFKFIMTFVSRKEEVLYIVREKLQKSDYFSLLDYEWNMSNEHDSKLDFYLGANLATTIAEQWS